MQWILLKNITTIFFWFFGNHYQIIFDEIIILIFSSIKTDLSNAAASQMNSYSAVELFLPTMAIFLFVSLISAKVVPSFAVAIATGAAKSLIFFIYFCFFFDGTYTFKDDIQYLEGARYLSKSGIQLSSISDKLSELFSIAGGDHIIYYLHNVFSFLIFGDGYYSPVALNIIFTAFAAWIGASIWIRHFSIHRRGLIPFYLFFIFHPDVVTWSTVFNGKDLLVLLHHLFFLKAISLLLTGNRWFGLFLLIEAVAVLSFLRFYVPVIFFGAFIIARIAQKFNIRNFISLFILAAIGFLLIRSVSGGLIEYAIASFRENMTNPFFGFLRMSLTPIPLLMDENYQFLNYSALMHWLMFPAAILGVARFIASDLDLFKRFFLIYFFSFMLLYSFYGELQGPRHRVQLDFAWAVFQFIGLSYCLKLIRRPARQDWTNTASGSPV